MNVLILSPHPDDEAIGCGAAVLQHVEADDDVHTVFVTSGERGVHIDDVYEARTLRETEAGAASQVLGTKSMQFWHEPDGDVRPTSDLVGRLNEVLTVLEIDLMYAPHLGEAHQDHRAVAKVARATAPLAGVQCYTYEVWTPLAEPEYIIDATPYIDGKLAAIRAHASQVALVAFDEAALALARYRGELHNRPHGPYAEAFGRF